MISMKDFDRLMSYIFLDFDTPAASVAAKWHDLFHQHDIQLLFAAARELAKKKTYGAPKPSDFAECITDVLAQHLPESLKKTGNQAFNDKTLLAKDARNFAERITDNSYMHHSHSSIDELHKAERIHNAIFRKNFCARYDELVHRSMQLVEQAVEPKLAIVKTLADSSYSELPPSLMSQYGLESRRSAVVSSLVSRVCNGVGEG